MEPKKGNEYTQEEIAIKISELEYILHGGGEAIVDVEAMGLSQTNYEVIAMDAILSKMQELMKSGDVEITRMRGICASFFAEYADHLKQQQ